MSRRWFTPPIVTVAILVGGAIGGAIVWRAGGAVRERDLAAYRAFERDALPIIDRAEQLASMLPDGDLPVVERAVVAARAVLDGEVSETEVLEPTVTWFAAALSSAQEAIDLIRARGDPTDVLTDARAAFATARENLEMLRARLRLPQR